MPADPPAQRQGPVDRAADPVQLVPDLGPALHDVYLASSKLHDVDPITAEMVRLRNARFQDCHLCQGIRYADALEAGVTDEMLDKVDDYEHSDLPERGRRRSAGRRLPPARAAPSAEVAEQLTEYFTPVEIAELLLRLNGWTNNKVFISLGLKDLDEIRPQVLAL